MKKNELASLLAKQSHVSKAAAADRLDYVGAGPGVLYRGTLAELPTSFGAGVADPATWTDGETHAYRFEVTLVGDERAQGRTARANFLFKARQA